MEKNDQLSLLPCPFCGGKADLGMGTQDYSERMIVEAVCGVCGARIVRETKLLDGNVISLSDNVIFMWNRRYNRQDKESIFPKEIKESPAVDAVEIIRCKDCKYYCRMRYALDDDTYTCRFRRGRVNPNDFCSYGERKKDEHT